MNPLQGEPLSEIGTTRRRRPLIWRYHVKTILTAVALAASVTAFLALPVTSANAATYFLNFDNCNGTCGQTSYGQINVSGETTGTLTIDIELNANTIFMQSGQNPHADVWFDTNTHTVDVEGLAAPFSANGSHTAGSIQPNGASLGSFDYDIMRASSGNPATAAGGQHSLTFTLSGPSSLALEYTAVGSNNLFFVVDVASFHPDGGALINTGRIGATIQGGVPEPASWALMILGFGGVGAALRSRRRPALAAAA